ncbi:thioredoxin family protein [Caldisalinibacter kiritimatiensis]|uniref:Redox-active disulfide protein 2 n=1 Tax=Caldisalinibacter kiritimatiensis TaxID=1304284 RepID=R1CDC3_9FIRM|nr:thioredoxin family protein [Caldisalinibacter kiritimatiensis]EOD00295.1 redox-active disulfide protein 2 [Caldisalinibacter kiritimatiensis]
MDIKVLGMGCAKCSKLEENVKEAVKELGIDATIEKVKDIKEIMSYGVMGTPGLVIDGEVKVAGRLADTEEIKKLIKGE